MYQDNVVLCGASAYEQKYYFNKDFNSLPDHVKKELQIMCVLYTEEIGGIFTLEFDDQGDLQFKTEAAEADGFYDDIGGALKIKQLQARKNRNFLNPGNVLPGIFPGRRCGRKIKQSIKVNMIVI